MHAQLGCAASSKPLHVWQEVSGSKDLGDEEDEEEEEEESDDDGSSVSLVSEDDIPSANVRHRVLEEEGQAAKRRRS